MKLPTRRLLLVVNCPFFFLSHRLPIALAAESAGWEVHIATAPEPASAVAAIHKQPFVHHPIPLSRSGLHPLKELRSVLALYHLYRYLQPDIVHQVTIKPVLYGGIVAKATGCPAVISAISGLGYIFTGRSLRHRALRRLAVVLYRAALRHKRGYTIFQNPEDRKTLKDLGITNDDQSVMVGGSGVKLDNFYYSPEPGGTPLVVLPARMLSDKGVVEFVEAARILRREGFAARFVLAGGLDPNPAALTAETLKEWTQEGTVEWWGHCDNMAQVFRECHLVALPSYREGLPLALAEAAASGRAVVTCDVPGCREVVRDGDNGLLVPARDSGALATAIRTLLKDPERRREMGRRGRERAEAEFSVDEVVRRHLELYESLV
ncbi:glycosyltransferase family 4 protein [Halorhodospira halochloris]|uniref:glycosyltransferase family 4 protein n=1 Tax=Halorhodospira halochloris TaxID=1052 RepID=UPI001EE87E44|nr:glycosyltransferase family 4 protein [Halorhodospira halochloris]MCG5531217.1 glycosyltransferase family 4 protein [Halorhodospira halochloris]